MKTFEELIKELKVLEKEVKEKYKILYKIVDSVNDIEIDETIQNHIKSIEEDITVLTLLKNTGWELSDKSCVTFVTGHEIKTKGIKIILNLYLVENNVVYDAIVLHRIATNKRLSYCAQSDVFKFNLSTITIKIEARHIVFTNAVKYS